MLKKAFAILVLLCLTAVAAVAQQQYLRQSLYFYDAGGNLEYVCSAASEGYGATSWTRAATTLTNIVDAANTATVTTSAAHGLTVGATVVIAGATVDTDLNGTYTVATVPLATTFTVTTANVTDATYTDATLSVGYNGPRTTAGIWSIERFYYDANGNMTKAARAVGETPAPIPSGRAPSSLVCADRATYTYR
jgi:uridine phosphorylase